MTDIRLPFSAIEELVRCDTDYDEPSAGDWSRRLHVDRSSISRWRKNGMPLESADRLAVRVLGVHPSAIWPDWFDLGCFEDELCG